MRPGDTFFLHDGSDQHLHLWVVLSDPSQNSDRILIVNITSWKLYHDPSCPVEIGDHEWIKKRSLVNYKQARFISLDRLEELATLGQLERHVPAGATLLRKMRRRAGDSHHLLPAYYALLDDQGLVDLDDDD